MKSRHFRFIIVLGLVSILSIAFLQYFWFKEAFDLQKKEFELKVYSALSEVAEEIFAFNGNVNQESFPVEQLSKNYFVVMINDHIEASLLDGLIKRKFQAKSLNAEYAFTVYDCASDNLIYGSDVVDPKNRATQLKLPKWEKDQYYFGVYFPNIENSLLKGMEELFALTAILLLVLLFFGISLFTLFRQKRLSEIQKDFINNMTHELKTPLSSIRLSTEFIRERKTWETDTDKYLEIISHESEKLQKQIENVLEQAKGEKDKLELQKETIDVKFFIKHIIDQFNLGRQKSIQYKIEEIGEEFKCALDKLHLEQVFYNLLDNIIKYGAEQPLLTIELKIAKNKLLIHWKDNGQGIPGKYKKLIFSPFFRLQKGNTLNTNGFGLGLHYVKKVIEAHKGRIRWISKDENGYFEIILPR